MKPLPNGIIQDKKIQVSAPKLLMATSVVLLIILEGFWLVNSYESAFINLRRETSSILRTTVFTIRDSLFMNNVIPVWNAHPTDSAVGDVHYRRGELPAHDTIVQYLGFRNTSAEGQKTRTSTTIINAFIDSVRSDEDLRSKKGQKFIVRIGPDSLSIEQLTHSYKSALENASLPVAFYVDHLRITPDLRPGKWIQLPDDPERTVQAFKPSPLNDTLHTERVRFNPAHVYVAYFPAVRTKLIREISPQILFSVFLTFITIFSFIVLYRGIRKQEQLMAMKNDFISNITHELKTPVATVSVALEALKGFNALQSPERTKEYLSIAQNELNRLSLMTDKILKTAVFESQGLSFISEPVHLDNIVRHVLDSIKIVLEKRKLQLGFTATGEKFQIMGSEMHITNVIYNLIDNAVKYSHDNSRIKINLQQTADSVVVEVKDYGIGIAKEYQQKVFDKFFRVPNGDVHNIKGYGLGLNYVSAVVKSHQGKVKLDSSPGEGSIFTITFPRYHGVG